MPWSSLVYLALTFIAFVTAMILTAYAWRHRDIPSAETFAGMMQAEVIVPERWPAAVGYAPWIEEVWANYVSNALKYGGTPPRVEVGADTGEEGYVRFWVRDNGPGLSAEQQAQLFTEFSRLHEARARGHGLGLSIVQRIVEKLGGKVGVESQEEQGSTFYFTLPAA